MPNETIDVPGDLKKHVIGVNGWTIKEIQRNSSAKVQTIETGFSMTGTEDQIQKAKGMIESIVEEQARYCGKARNEEKMNKSKEMRIPLYMKRFLFHYNNVRKGRTFEEIKAKTKTKIEDRPKKDDLLLIGTRVEDIQAAEEMIDKLQVSIAKSLVQVKLPEDPKIIGLIKGHGGETVKKIQEQTQTCIQIKEPYVYIYGENNEQQRKAKLKIKEIASNRLKSRRFREKCQMSFVDDSFVNEDSDEFSLKEVVNPPWRWVGQHHKIVSEAKVRKEQDREIEGLDDLVENVHQKLRELKEHDDRDSFKIDFWCHYGNVYVKNVDEEDEGVTYSADKLKEYIRDAWQTTFDGGIKELNVDKLKEEYGEDAVPPYTQYDFSVLSPSCRRINMKTTLRRNEHGKLEFSSLDPEATQKRVYDLATPTVQHIKIHVIILNTDIDCCLNIQTKFKKDSHTHENDDDDELKVLKKFLDKRLKLEGEVLEPIKPNEFPAEYDLTFWRKSERRIFKDDYGFTITASKEESENVDGLELGKNVVRKTSQITQSMAASEDNPLQRHSVAQAMNDVQVHLNNSDKKLFMRKCQSDQTTENNDEPSVPKWQGDQTTQTDNVPMPLCSSDESSIPKDQTRKYVKKVLSFAREVQQFFSSQDPGETE